MHEIYIKYATTSILSSANQIMPRDRFVQYYNDLYKLNEDIVNPSTFLHGTQYDYASLGRSVLDTCYVNGDLTQSDMLICSTWSHEFDPDYSSSGPYFSERYNIPYVFDVCDSGSITPYLSLKILIQYMKSGASQKAILLGLEQTCIPRNLDDNVVMPSITGAGALILSNNHEINSSNNIRLVYADIINEMEILTHKFNISELIRLKCLGLDVELDKINLVMKKSSTMYKAYKMYKHQVGTIPLHNSMKYLNNECGVLPFFIYMESIIKNSLTDISYIAIVDEDVESLSIGVVICEILK